MLTYLLSPLQNNDYGNHHDELHRQSRRLPPLVRNENSIELKQKEIAIRRINSTIFCKVIQRIFCMYIYGESLINLSLLSYSRTLGGISPKDSSAMSELRTIYETYYVFRASCKCLVATSTIRLVNRASIL